LPHFLPQSLYFSLHFLLFHKRTIPPVLDGSEGIYSNSLFGIQLMSGASKTLSPLVLKGLYRCH
jgi:hypothetical protein